MQNIKYQRNTGHIDLKLYIRRIALIILDSLLVMFSSVLALEIRFEFGAIDEPFMKYLSECLLMFTGSSLLIFYVFRMYHSLWEYISAKEVRNIIFASSTVLGSYPIESRI